MQAKLAIAPKKLNQRTYMQNIRTYGLELEFFMKIKDKYVAPTRGGLLTTDDCGYLAEARGDKHAKPREAVALLQAAIDRLKKQARLSGIILERVPTAPVEKELLRTLLRARGKNISHSFFAHGGCYRSSKPRAGLHIHFGTLDDVFDSHGKIITTFPKIANIPRVIHILDTAFKEEIAEASRVRGEYEIKPHGFEYRSLPSDVDLNKVITVLEGIDEETDGDLFDPDDDPNEGCEG